MLRIGRDPLFRRASIVLAALMCALLALVLSAQAPGRGPKASWVAAWGLPVNSAADQSFHDQTIRMVLLAGFGGARVRIHLSNVEGTQPLRLSNAHIGIELDGAGVRAKTNVPLTFHGSSGVTIPPGKEAVSDPANLRVRALEHLVVSVYAPLDTGPGTGDGELGTYYTAVGDRADASRASAFGRPSGGGYFVTGVDVYAPNDGLIVAFGDSLTAGWHADYEGWPYWLARRLVQLAAHGGPRLSVIDMGISGNRVLPDPSSPGDSAEERLKRDVLDQTGLKGVLMMEGINDIGHSGPAGAPVTELEAGLARIVNRVHRAGAAILLSPLTPSGDPETPAPYNSGYSDPAGVQARDEVNDWIRQSSGAYVPGFDFEPVIADPASPDQISPAYDSGDHLHPNLAGQRAMGNSIALSTVEELVRGSIFPSSPGAPAAPTIRTLRIAPRAFADNITGVTARPRQREPTVSYAGNEPAVVTFTVLARAQGVRRGRRCLPPSRSSAADGPTCVRYVAIYRFRRIAHIGPNRFALTAALSRHSLKPGSYRLAALPSLGGIKGAVVAVSFRVKLPPPTHAATSALAARSSALSARSRAARHSKPRGRPRSGPT